VSNTIIVLVFSELNCFVRKILQAEENKGVELTGERRKKTRKQKLESRKEEGGGGNVGGSAEEGREVHCRQLKLERKKDLTQRALRTQRAPERRGGRERGN